MPGRFADPQDHAKGIEFDGRIAEDFKLMSGVWVHVGALRVHALSLLAPVAQDIVVAGHDRESVAFLIFANPAGCRGLCPDLAADAPLSQVLADPRVVAHVRAGMGRLVDEGGGSSMVADRALLMEEPASIDAGEITDKGYINQRAVLTRRAALVQSLYASNSFARGHPATQASLNLTMDLQIAILLAQDGITNGAIYALLALALVLVFAVTRVIFIPQGEFVALGALTLASLQVGKTPGTLWLLLAAGITVALVDLTQALQRGSHRRIPRIVAWNLIYPALAAAAIFLLKPAEMAMPLQIILTLMLVVPLGPMIYRLAFQPLAEAPVLVLLIVAVAVHLALVGLGLLFFGAEGSRTPPFSDASYKLGGIVISGQTLWVVGASVTLIVILYLFFERTFYGKALRATAMNRTGARLMGISSVMAGKLSFLLAALIGALSGVLIAPITTIYYDTGFLIGLKGFVGAIVGGLASYPIAAVGAILVGLLEAYSSFWASAFKEVIVFTLIIPVLVWRSLTTHHVEEEE